MTFHQYICGGVINKVKKFKSDDIPRLVKSLKNFIRKSYDLVTFRNSFRWVRFTIKTNQQRKKLNSFPLEFQQFNEHIIANMDKNFLYQ
jgi:hypothetical protein